MTDPTDATVIPLSRVRRNGLGTRPQRAAIPTSSPSATDQTGLLFEVPQTPPSRPRIASASARSTKPRMPAETTSAKPRKPVAPPKRPALRTANSEDELVEDIKRTRRVRVTYEATVHETYWLGGKLTLVLDCGDGQRECFKVEGRGALVEVIQKDGA